MKVHKISVVIFYDKNNVLIQDRKEFETKRFGEEYGFFGGKIEQGETSEQALKREIKEELNIKITNFHFFRKYVQKFKALNSIVERYVFISPMPNLEKLRVDEGKPFVSSFKESSALKMMPGDKRILKEIYNSIKNKIIY